MIQSFSCFRGQHLPSKGMYSMKRTSRGFVSVSNTNSSSSSSLRPRITTQFTYRGRQTAVNHPLPVIAGERRQLVTKCIKTRKPNFDKRQNVSKKGENEIPKYSSVKIP